MRIMIIGSGGREHALAWKLSLSSWVQKIYCIPGNPGIAQVAKCLPANIEDSDRLIHLAVQNEVDLVVIGPETPLAAGLVDDLTAAGVLAFGPGKAAAQLESSKVFAKQLMERYQIPTAAGSAFTGSAAALAEIEKRGTPIVVKADGLAAGKGVVVAATREEAAQAVRRIMDERAFGEAGKKVLLEEYLVGEEVSVLSFTDGETIIPMASAQDHKAVFDGDDGPNTGGMGAISPAPQLTPELLSAVQEEVLVPTIRALRREGIVFRGVLYAGLMITADGPKVLEFNVRFGDPECQVILPRLKSDLGKIMLATINGNLSEKELRWHNYHTACVVMASGGYPGPYEKNHVIAGLEQAASMQDTLVFHAGTALQEGNIVTNGGRVLSVTAWGATLPAALDKTYAACRSISFDGAHYRKDIGHRALRHIKESYDISFMH
ncbi:MAG: Phosphoribosylamine--glycine ligase [Syntrophomonadaceae bacterium]|nr:Phosphoribosylamine--glycine ligase [Bacillota bacterium]